MVLGYNDLVHDGVWMMPHLFRSLCLALIWCGRNLRGLKVRTFLDSLEDGTEDDPNLFMNTLMRHGRTTTPSCLNNLMIEPWLDSGQGTLMTK